MVHFQKPHITLLSILCLVTTVIGACLGFSIGARYFGKVGAVTGPILGFIIGYIIGSLPDRLGTWFVLRYIRRASDEKLRAMIADPCWNFFHTMALLQLAARDREVHSELPRVIAMLESDSQVTRLLGWDALRIVFTWEYKLMEGYDPRSSNEECRKKAAFLKESLERKEEKTEKT